LQDFEAADFLRGAVEGEDEDGMSAAKQFLRSFQDEVFGSFDINLEQCRIGK
jgi:hypothetical protein